MDKIARIKTVFHYINEMIRYDWSYEDVGAFGEATSIEKLSSIACMSVRSFQNFFQEQTGESPGSYVNRVRLEYATFLLKQNRLTQKEIAQRTGWANDAGFYKGFKGIHNQTPTKYKLERFGKCFETEFERVDYRIIELPETPILFFVYQGNYDDFVSDVFEEESWQQLYEYAELNNILPANEEYWGICFDDRDITAENKCRFYAGMTVNALPKLQITNHVKSMILPKGSYAVFTYKGSYAGLDAFHDAILRQLLEGYNLGEGLILERYLNNTADTPESELLTEVLLPVVRC